MKPAPPDPAELVPRMRQQLILVQVRLMELEDARDETASRLAECQQLLRAAQTLADQKLDEAVHLEQVRGELQAQYEHLRNMQHVTNEALNAVRIELAAEKETAGSLGRQLADLAAAHGQLESRHAEQAAELRESLVTAAARQQRIGELDAERTAMRRSRSWRWTAGLRSLERLFGDRKT